MTYIRHVFCLKGAWMRQHTRGFAHKNNRNTHQSSTYKQESSYWEGNNHWISLKKCSYILHKSEICFFLFENVLKKIS